MAGDGRENARERVVLGAGGLGHLIAIGDESSGWQQIVPFRLTDRTWQYSVWFNREQWGTNNEL